MLGLDFGQAGASTAHQIATDLRTRVVSGTREPARLPVHIECCAVTVHHPHVGSIAVESDEARGARS